MNTIEAAKRLGIKETTLRAYLRKNKVEGYKNKNGMWEIPEYAIKPLNNIQIKAILIYILKFQHNQTERIDLSSIDENEGYFACVLRYLKFNNFIYYEVCSTLRDVILSVRINDKGFELLIKNTKKFDLKSILLKIFSFIELSSEITKELCKILAF